MVRFPARVLKRHEDGFSLLELVVVLTISATVPPTLGYAR
ncbi:prepilin-type N-terminal cleavage/methylation domain-containing protein [Ammonifex degensii]